MLYNTTVIPWKTEWNRQRTSRNTFVVYVDRATTNACSTNSWRKYLWFYDILQAYLFLQQTAKTGVLFLYPRLSTIAVLHLRHFETSFTNYKREEPDANRIIVIRLKTLGSYTNIQIGSTYTDLNDYSYFYTLHDIENYYVYDRAKFTYLIDKSKVIFKQLMLAYK